MSLTVDTLNKSILGGSSLVDTIREQLLVIDKMLTRSDKVMGSNIVIYDLPTMFPTLPTDTSTTKKMIYARIIESLENRGFTCSLKILNPDKVQLLIRWNIGVNNSELEQLEAYLKTKLEPRKEGD